MSALARIKKTVAQHEQDRQYDKALALYARLLDGSEAGGEELDVGLYNRAGDLALRAGDTPRAIGYFERALDLYAAGGFLNNAIALGVKILRHAPAHLSAHYTLGVLYGRKGFASDSRHHMLTYAVQMQRANRHDEAARVVREVADACHDDAGRRAALDAYGALGGDVALASVLSAVPGARNATADPTTVLAGNDRARGSLTASSLELLDLSAAGPQSAPSAPAASDAVGPAAVGDLRWSAALPGEPPALRLGDLADVQERVANDDRSVLDDAEDELIGAPTLEMLDVSDTRGSAEAPLPLDLIADDDDADDPFTVDLDAPLADRRPPARDVSGAAAGLDFLDVAPDGWTTDTSEPWTLHAAAKPADVADRGTGVTVGNVGAAGTDADEGLDLGAWLREVTPQESTRMTTSVVPQTGDEQADFDATLKAFTAGVSRAVDHEDFDSHYDLGVAFREMGLLEEAVVEFQRAARAPSGTLRAHEALAQCFLDAGQPELALSTLGGPAASAAREGAGDASLIAVHYLLGAAAEALGRFEEARGWFVRVVATDVRFRDAGDRLAALRAPAPAARSSPTVTSPI